MTQTAIWLKNGLALVGDLLLIPLGLLLFVLLAVVARPLFVIAMPLVALCVVVSALGSAIRDRWGARVADERVH